MTRWSRCVALVLSSVVPLTQAVGQELGSGSRNLRMLGHVTAEDLKGDGTYSSIAIDQIEGRSFAYIGGGSAWWTVDIATPSSPTVLHASPVKATVSDLTHFRLGGKTLVAVASGEQIEIFDVSGIGEGSPPSRMVALTADSTARLFAYRHSNGQALLVVAAGEDALIYDVQALVGGSTLPVAKIATPDQIDPNARGFERPFAAYHADTETDRFYGAGAGGYHIYDIARLDSPTYLTSATPAAVRRGHMVSVTPDDRFLLAGAEYRAAPLRIFDMKPAYDGQIPVIRTSIGAWTDDWTSFLIAHETRWPYVFVASGEHGLQVFNMRNAQEPYTDAYFRTSEAPAGAIDDRVTDVDGAIDVDVRNSDGLVAVLDRQTGLWLLTLEGFQGWDGRGYGVPNISSVQDWENGPVGTDRY